MLNKIIRHARKKVYQWGFRPKPGSILYSPSMDLLAQGTDFLKLFAEEYAKGISRAKRLLDERDSEQ